MTKPYEEPTVIQRDLPAFEALFKKYYTALCIHAYDFVNRHELAEEIVQDTFMKVWERFHELEIQTSEKAYLYKAVQNNCFNFIKQDRVRLQYGEALQQQLEARIALLSLPSEHSPIDKLLHLELEQLTEQAIERLPAQCRDIFRLSRFEQLSYPEIALKLGLSVNTVKTQMARALQKLRDDLLPLLKKR
jgi:RNA polymerase sigma-70 factor (family 1)